MYRSYNAIHYRSEIDGLRAIAVLPVILFHTGAQTFAGGFVGVDIFFVISGYLITTIILAEKLAGTFMLFNFYERRARRILPALFTVMFACLPFAWAWMSPSYMKEFSQSLVAVYLFVSNVFFWREGGYFEPASGLRPLLHTWSLAVEEQYYLLFPVFLMLTWQLGKRWIVGILVVVAVSSLAIAQWGALNKPAATFYLLPTRGWELLLGVFVAFYLFTKEGFKANEKILGDLASFVGLLLIMYAVFAFDKKTPFPSLYTLVPTIGAALVILFASPNTIVGALLGIQLFVSMGLISYSAYLWHQPLFAFARHLNISEPSVSLWLVLLFLVIALAYVSWRYVEQPFRDKNKNNRKALVSLGLSCGAFFLIFGLIGHYTDGYEWRFNDEVRAIYRARYDTNPRTRECLTWGADYIRPHAACSIGDESRIIGALLGDSHANSVAHELEIALKTRKIGMKHMSYAGCPPVMNVYRVDAHKDTKCDDYNKEVFRYLSDADDNQFIVLVARWTLYLEKFGFDNGEGGAEEGEAIYVDALENKGKLSNTEPLRISIVKDKYKQSVLEYLLTSQPNMS